MKKTFLSLDHGAVNVMTKRKKLCFCDDAVVNLVIKEKKPFFSLDPGVVNVAIK